MGLKLYNSLTRRKEEFKPLEEGRVGIYVCGPTVYGHPHLGHAKSYVSFDILVRYLRYLGYSVTYVQNITDVGHLTDDADEGEDKLVVAAKKEKKHPMALAEYYARSYFEDMDRLNCHRPDISPRATGHIIEQIELVKILLEKGYAYEVNGSVYFEVAKFPDYGKLSRRNLDEMLEGVRVKVSPDKRAPADFALWKKAEPNHIMQWPSPWGAGFPGWHLECSVMSMKYLGKTIDIHGGGLENQFPHHDCEIAQSEAANLNNFITLKQAFSGAHERLTRSYEPLAVRQLILNSHYRSPLDFSDAALFAAQSGYQKITEAVKAVRKRMGMAVEGQADKKTAKQLKQLRVKFEAAMNDDLNTSVALSVLFELVRLTQVLLTQVLLEDSNTNVGVLNLVEVLFDRLGGEALGIVKDEYPQAGAADDEVVDKLVDVLIQQRNEARANKESRI
ncbi:MAG: cysteine--tRNA ligase [Planctomycetota bacterium]|jgi:cysteinyl-tRNA synthetase